MAGDGLKGSHVTQAKPTILQIIPRLDTGGAELSTIEITQAVVRGGGRMIVLSEGGRLTDEISRAGGEWIAFPAATKNPASLLLNSRRIASLVRERGVDLLHARSRAPAWSALLAARRTRKPLVTTYHGAYGSTGRLKTQYNSVMARGDAVIANSRFTADLIRARGGLVSAPGGQSGREARPGCDRCCPWGANRTRCASGVRSFLTLRRNPYAMPVRRSQLPSVGDYSRPTP